MSEEDRARGVVTEPAWGFTRTRFYSTLAASRINCDRQTGASHFQATESDGLLFSTFDEVRESSTNSYVYITGS